jgi:DNA-binding beta-propeller fold protein YncE
VVDTKTLKVLATVALPGHARYLSAPSGLWIYATTQEGSLYAIGLSDPHQVMLLLSGGQFGPMDFNENTGEVYVPDVLHKQVDQIKPPDSLATVAPHEPAFTYTFSSVPQSVAITSDGQYGFVALGDGQVAMLDIPGKELIQTFNVGGSPNFIITGVYPPALGNTPQQASVIDTIATVAAYILVAAIVIVPAVFVIRQNRKRRAEQQEEDIAEE